MVEVVVGPIVHRDTLCRQPVPRLQIEWKQCRDWRPLVVAEIMPADLPVLVRQAEGVAA